MGLKGKGKEGCTQGQGRKGGGSADKSELGKAKLGVVVEVGEQSSEVDD